VSAVASTVAIMDEIEPELTWDEKLVIVGVFAALVRRPETGAFRTPRRGGANVGVAPGAVVPKPCPAEVIP
jgi:hypothetical protein